MNPDALFVRLQIRRLSAKGKALSSTEVVDPTSYVRPGARRALQLMGAGRRPYEIFEGTLPIKCHSLWAPTGTCTTNLRRQQLRRPSLPPYEIIEGTLGQAWKRWRICYEIHKVLIVKSMHKCTGEKLRIDFQNPALRDSLSIFLDD